MRRGMVIVCFVAFWVVNARAAEIPADAAEALLEQGQESYRSGNFSQAIDELRAADAMLAPSTLEGSARTGHLDKLPQYELALVYLTMAYAKQGRDKEAGEAVLRLLAAERIDPVYAGLTLSPEVAGFEALASRVAPDVSLPPNMSLAGPSPVAVAGSPAMAGGPERSSASAMTQEERTAMLQEIERQVAEARSRIEAEAQSRIAAIQRAADERIATERRACERLADERIAAVRKATAALPAASSASRRTRHRKATSSVAASHDPNKRRGARGSGGTATPEKSRPGEPVPRQSARASLRKAESEVAAGRVSSAREIYARVARSPGMDREALALAATGLYRTGDYAGAVETFRRLMPFARGEEDLRYYHAVALYETGQYDESVKELACALPFIQISEEVARYKTKIERSADHQLFR